MSSDVEKLAAMLEEIKKMSDSDISSLDFSTAEINHIVRITNSASGLLDSAFVVFDKMSKLSELGHLNLHPTFNEFFNNWIDNYKSLQEYSSDKYDSTMEVH